MGEWSEYFEDFPEENPASRHESKLTKDELAIIQAKFEKEQAELLVFENEVNNTPILKVDTCPCCYAERMEIRLLKDNKYYCKCSECRVVGEGGDLEAVMDELSNRIWDQQ